MMEQQVMGMAQQMEDALDDELHKMNNMSTDDLEDIRRKRLEAMKAGQTRRKELNLRCVSLELLLMARYWHVTDL